jgi:hypothetical protein
MDFLRPDRQKNGFYASGDVTTGNERHRVKMVERAAASIRSAFPAGVRLTATHSIEGLSNDYRRIVELKSREIGISRRSCDGRSWSPAVEAGNLGSIPDSHPVREEMRSNRRTLFRDARQATAHAAIESSVSVPGSGTETGAAS